MSVQKFRVSGLTHEAEGEIERRLRGVEGVLFAAASHRDACAEVEFEDDAVTTDELRGVFRDLGLDASIAG